MLTAVFNEIKASSKGENIFYFGLFLMGVGLPTSRFLMSISYIFLGLGWLLQSKRVERLKSFFSFNSALFLSSIFLLHIVSLLWTEDFVYAWKDIRVKIPMLFFPFLLYTMPRLNKEKWNMLINCFILSVVITSTASLVNYLAYKNGWRDGQITDVRDAFLFISHIRLALMISLSSIWLIFKGKELAWHIGFRLIVISFFLFFLFYMQALSGLVSFLICLFVIMIYRFKQISKIAFSMATSILILAIVYLGIIVRQEYNLTFVLSDSSINTPQELSFDKAPLSHFKQSKSSENGFLLGINVQEGELRTEWNKRSNFDYDGIDLNNNKIKHTLKRYITSQGIIKDGKAVRDLKKEEILAIESGIPNHRYLEVNPFEKRINQIMYELKNHLDGGNPDGHSLAQRFVYLQTGWQIWKENQVIGTGVGDVNQSFLDMYEKNDSRLSEKRRLRAHNQILTWLITFGLLGFLYILFVWIHPVMFTGNGKSLFYISFFVIFLISCMNEDTIETQAGLSFYAFFSSYILFSKKSK